MTPREHAVRAKADAFVARELRQSDEVLLTEYATAIGAGMPSDEFGLSRLVASLRRSMRDALACDCCNGTGESERDYWDEDGGMCCPECESTGVTCGSDPRWVVMPDGTERELNLEVRHVG